MARREKVPRRNRRSDRQRRGDIVPPYTVLPSGWRHPAWWLAPGLAVFCFFFGAFYAITTPYLIVPMTGGRVELTTIDGHVRYGEDKKGEAFFLPAGETHQLRNLNDHAYDNVLVELKKS